MTPLQDIGFLERRVNELELVVAVLLRRAGVLGTLTPVELDAVRVIGDRALKQKSP
jgi:hypothetical protein